MEKETIIRTFTAMMTIVMMITMARESIQRAKAMALIILITKAITDQEKVKEKEAMEVITIAKAKVKTTIRTTMEKVETIATMMIAMMIAMITDINGVMMMIE